MPSVSVTSAVTMKITSYELYVASYFAVTKSSTIIMKTTAFYELPPVWIQLYNQRYILLTYKNVGLPTSAAINEISFVSIANAISPVITKIVTSFALPFYNIDSSSSTIYDKDPSAGKDSPVIIMMPTQVDSSRSSSSSYNNSYTDGTMIM